MADDKEHSASVLKSKPETLMEPAGERLFHTEIEASGLQTLAAARMRSNHELIVLCLATSQQTWTVLLTF